MSNLNPEEWSLEDDVRFTSPRTGNSCCGHGELHGNIFDRPCVLRCDDGPSETHTYVLNGGGDGMFMDDVIVYSL